MRRKQMLALSILFFCLAGVFLAYYYFENQRPIDDTPIYPSTPDNTGPEIYFVPAVPVIRAIHGQEIVISIIVVDWQNDILFHALYHNDQLLDEGSHYIVYRPGTTEYPRNVFTGCYDEFRILWRTYAWEETAEHDLRIVTEDSAGNPSSMFYSFTIEVVQNAPDYQVRQPGWFTADQPVIEVEVQLLANQTMVKSMDVYVSGNDMGPLFNTGGNTWELDIGVGFIPTGLHTLEIVIRLRSGLLIIIYKCIVIHNPSLIPSLAPAIGVVFAFLGIIMLLIRREKRPEDEKHLVGVDGKLYLVEKEKKKENGYKRKRKKKSLW